jgi:hypothetical protein
MSTKPVVSVTTPNGPLVDVKSGNALFAFLKWMQQVGQLLNEVFDNQGVLSPDSIPFPSSNAIGGVTTAGPAASKWINAIGTNGIPTLTQPAFTDLSGTASPSQVPSIDSLNGTLRPSQVPQLSLLEGAVTAAQVPQLSQLTGMVTPAQVPSLDSLNGQITAAQGPAGAFSGTITTAKLTTGGTNGSMTFTNGILTSEVAAT